MRRSSRSFQFEWTLNERSERPLVTNGLEPKLPDYLLNPPSQLAYSSAAYPETTFAIVTICPTCRAVCSAA